MIVQAIRACVVGGLLIGLVSEAFAQERLRSSPAQAQSQRQARTLSVSLQSDKGVYNDNERVKLSGRVVPVPAGDPVPAIVEIRVYRKIGFGTSKPIEQKQRLDIGSEGTTHEAAPSSRPARSNQQRDQTAEQTKEFPQEAPPSSVVEVAKLLVDVKDTQFTTQEFVIQFLPLLGDETHWDTQRIDYIARANVVPLVPGLFVGKWSADTSFSARAFGLKETFKIFFPPVLAALLIPITILFVFTIKPDRRAATLTLWGVYTFGLYFLFGSLIGPLLLTISPDTQTFLRATPIGIAKATATHIREPQWLWHVGGVVTPGDLIQGGFSVPLFVLTLAMVGGVVNMLIQLPKCLAIYYKITAQSPEPSTVADFRRDVCTYFVGILSAPFLGMIVYSLLTMTDYTNPAALAVAALSVGFASNRIVDALLRALNSILKADSNSSLDQSAADATKKVEVAHAPALVAKEVAQQETRPN
jgi:hypothetical protein